MLFGYADTVRASAYIIRRVDVAYLLRHYIAARLNRYAMLTPLLTLPMLLPPFSALILRHCRCRCLRAIFADIFALPYAFRYFRHAIFDIFDIFAIFAA